MYSRWNSSVTSLWIPTQVRVPVLTCTPSVSGCCSHVKCYGGVAHQLVISQMFSNCYWVLTESCTHQRDHFQAASSLFILLLFHKHKNQLAVIRMQNSHVFYDACPTSSGATPENGSVERKVRTTTNIDLPQYLSSVHRHHRRIRLHLR